MTRVFPGFLVFPIIGWLVSDLLRGGPPEDRRLPEDGRVRRRHLLFMAHFCVACTLLFGASHTTGQGMDTWPSWYSKIAKHSATHATTSDQRIGVGRMALHTVHERRFWSQERGTPEAKMAASATRRHVLQAIGLLLLLLALRRRTDEDAMILMLFLVFLFVVTSRYYASTWMLFAVMGLGGGARDGPQAWPGLLMTVGLLVFSWAFYLPDANTSRYFLVNYLAYGTFVLTCLAFIIYDAMDWRRSRSAGGIEAAAAASSTEISPAEASE
jgi:hypothetical protein